MDLAAQVTAALETRRLGRPLEWRESVGSTNELARTLARAGAPEGLAVLAEEQTAGRGRLGRGWQSPAGAGIWLSVVLRPALPLQHLPVLTLAAAVAVAEAVRAAGAPAGIKWPNDVMIEGRKCCGILTELELAGELACAVVGIGLNVNQPHLPPELAAGATSLRLALGRPLERAPLVCTLLERLEARYDQLLAGEAAAVLGAWRALSVTLGRRVRVAPAAAGGPALLGTAEDVDGDGALLLRREDGSVLRLLAGEVSLREG